MACDLSGAKDITWTNAGIFVIGPRGTNFNEILIEIHEVPWRKYVLKYSLRNVVPFAPAASTC